MDPGMCRILAAAVNAIPGRQAGDTGERSGASIWCLDNRFRAVKLSFHKPPIHAGNTGQDVSNVVERSTLSTLPGLNFNVFALGAFERVQLVARKVRLYAKEPHLCSALGAVRSFNRIRVRWSRL